MNKEIEKILQEEEIGGLIISALTTFLRQDYYLLQADVNERSLTHRVGIYLQDEMPAWDVDCEYNRDDHDPKELYLPDCHPDSHDTNAQTVYPDIIVHRRGKQENLLVIEFKKTSSNVSDDKDFIKLREYKNQLEYMYALFVEFDTEYDGKGINRVQWVSQ